MTSQWYHTGIIVCLLLYLIATDVIKDEINISPTYLPPPEFKLVPTPTALTLSGRQQQQQQQQHQQHQHQHHYQQQQQQQKCDDELDQVHDNKDRQQNRNVRDSVKGEEQEATISDHKPH